MTDTDTHAANHGNPVPAEAGTEGRSGDTHAKALALNLNQTVYGSFAEIGAGQEVARWFLTVGAASGTVAKTISAYDKTVSDTTYGTGTRYVSRERLQAMLDREYSQLTERLAPARGATSRFFAFANTASTKAFRGHNDQHAWVGLRFQASPGEEPSDVLLHVHFTAPTAHLQQLALGVLGVNLLDAAVNRRESVDTFLGGLWDDLTAEQLEIDVLELRGPAFHGVDQRVWNLELVRRGMTHAVVFGPNNTVMEPSEVLRKRPVVVNRGTFAVVESFYEQMLVTADKALRAERPDAEHEPVRMLEITLHSALGDDAPANDELMLRVERLLPLGPVAVTDYPEAYSLAGYLRRYTAEPIRFVLGVALLARILEERFYKQLPGRILEGLGRLLDQEVKLYAYPMPREVVESALGPAVGRFRVTPEANGLVTADDLIPEPPIDHLYRYLRSAGWVEPVSPD